MPDRLYLSPPHMGGEELRYVRDCFDSNWIAPVGPHVDAFEAEFAETVGSAHAVALASGTAALHLALILAGVEPGDDVLVSTLTFAASVNPIVYLDARPFFVDSEPGSWNLDPELLDRALAAASRPAAVVLVHLYGQSADLDAICDVCDRHGVPLIEDAAEALGATYRGRQPGTFGQSGIFSFNGNKIITASSGGMLVTDDGALAARARKLATQARDPAPHYQHSEIGYNYRLSNVLAAIGRAQLALLDERVRARRENCEAYREAFADLSGLAVQPEAGWGRHSRWLSCVLVDPEAFGVDRESLRLALEDENVESRPLWKPMHLQPVFRGYPTEGGGVAESLFERGLCLPSGSQMTPSDRERVTSVVRRVHERARGSRS